jgi:hypothetical protein
MVNDNLISPYKFRLNEQGILEEIHSKQFDSKAYSRMKYGVRTDLKYFARMLADELLKKAPHLYKSDKPPAIMTAYKAVAAPSTTLARYCLDIINLSRFKASLAPGEMVKVLRPTDYIEEYATLSESERKKIIEDDSAHSLQGRNLEGYQPVIIDDIYVTGTYTAMMQRVLAGYEEVTKAYIIVCDNSVKSSADAENLLNSSEIRKLSDLLQFINQDNFVFTRRFLKMLLRADDTELRLVIDAVPELLLEEIVRGIIDTDSELQNIYPEACSLIFEEASKRHIFK